MTDTDDPTVRFRASSAGAATRVPASFTTHKLYRDVIGVGPLRTALFSRVNEGQLIVNYLGHGSTYIWGTSGELLSRADIGTNWTTTGSRLPFVVAMNCLNGFFQSTDDEESLAETLLRANGGAVAVWASSSLTEAEPQGVMNDELFRLLFTQGAQATLGDAVAAAKSGVRSSDVRRSWIFFGDPAMRLKGLPVATATRAADAGGGTGRPELRRRHVRRNIDHFTPAQTVRVTQTGTGTVTWTASANQPWIQITNGTGTGTGRFNVTVVPTGLPPSGTATGTVAITVNGSHERANRDRARLDHSRRNFQSAVWDDRHAAPGSDGNQRRVRRHRLGARRRGRDEAPDIQGRRTARGRGSRVCRATRRSSRALVRTSSRRIRSCR